MRPEKQMIRSATTRIVTMMENAHSHRNRTICFAPSDAVGSFVPSGGVAYNTIPSLIFPSSPNPALTKMRLMRWNRSVLVNKVPKFMQWFCSRGTVARLGAIPSLYSRPLQSVWLNVKRFATLLANQRNRIGPSARHRAKEHAAAFQSARRNQKLFAASLANDGDFGRTPFGRNGCFHGFRSFRYGEGLLALRLFLFTSTAAVAAILK